MFGSFLDYNVSIVRIYRTSASFLLDFFSRLFAVSLGILMTDIFTHKSVFFYMDNGTVIYTVNLIMVRSVLRKCNKT